MFFNLKKCAKFRCCQLDRRHRPDFVEEVRRLFEKEHEFKKACDVACALDMFHFPKVKSARFPTKNLFKINFKFQECFVIPLVVEDKSAVAENYLEHCKPMQAIIFFCQHRIRFAI